MIGRSLVARHAIEVTELAMEVAGGAAFYRENGLERCFRDIQGALSSDAARSSGAIRVHSHSDFPPRTFSNSWRNDELPRESQVRRCSLTSRIRMDEPRQQGR
ncbi:hypothetical protein LP421_06315 [Rhizobium sp. RCAM05350]|nr:hypothetical protein LP421_06315 [Rhizobium sp. RCAM05350]